MELFRNQQLASTANVVSQPFEIGDDNALFVQAGSTPGTAGPRRRITVEGSNDMTNWLTAYATVSGTYSSPPSVYGGNALISGNPDPLTARYLRIKVIAAGVATNFNLSVNSKHL